MDLRFTETNSADDHAGQAFGLDGNLYLPVVLTGVGGIGLFGILGLVIHFPYAVAGAVAATPCVLTVLWVLLLRRGKPAGYDRDKLEDLVGGGHFVPEPARQREMLA